MEHRIYPLILIIIFTLSSIDFSKHSFPSLGDIEVVNQESRNFEFNIKPLTERCDKFQGCQTYDDWIYSTSAVPCGFLSPSGYDAFMESKAFKHCKIVVYTVIHGGYDVLKSVSERESLLHCFR